MWESKIWGRWVSWFISCGHGTVSHQLQFSADLLQKWRDILWSKFANVSLMFFATYPQIFIPFYLVVLAAVTFLHIKESYCSPLSGSVIELWRINCQWGFVLHLLAPVEGRPLGRWDLCRSGVGHAELRLGYPGYLSSLTTGNIHSKELACALSKSSSVNSITRSD